MTTTTLDRLQSTLASDPRLGHVVVTRPHPSLVAVRRDVATVLVAPASAWSGARDALRPWAARFADATAVVVLLGPLAGDDLSRALARGLASVLPAEPSDDELAVAVQTSFELLDAKRRAESRGQSADRYRYEFGELVEIARAITEERDIDKLLGLILEKSRFVTGADAGSIYVVEGEDGDPGGRQLRFKMSQNDSVAFDAREFSIPLNPRSMAGAAALSRKPINIVDVYAMAQPAPFGFDRTFDDKVGYRTKSVLSVPLVSHDGEVIGVIQLINKKRDAQARLHSPAAVEAAVVPFDARSEELLSTLASQAGISLDNALLLAEIRTIFEGFVRASVEAIEQRDPTTSGHSRRVAELTMGLARAVELCDSGPYREARFSEHDLREIEYASLLHDFGKIGVREQVLVKAKKLYGHELEIIRQRFEIALRSLEAEVLSKKLAAVQRGVPLAALEALDLELETRRATLVEAMAAIESANEPTVLKGGDFARIEAIARESYIDVCGVAHPLLAPAEVASLSVTKGSLTHGEIDEIRSHVTHTFSFLSTIPWGKTFRRVPIIAGAHHEKLNGTGYPHRLRAEEIPLQSKLMSIADIFDALTASDRPYKRAVPVERALDILALEVKDSHIDGDLVAIFRDGRVWEPVMGGLY